MRLYVIIGAALAALSIVTIAFWKTYEAGRRAEQAAIAERITKENEDAGNNAEDWRAALRRCAASGGVFNFETGACE